MKKSLLKLCSIIAGATIICSTISTLKPIQVQAANMRPATDIVKEMGIGWNLGNSLDAKMSNLSYNASPAEFETGWGNPVTTKAMIDTVKNAGFKTIRIPTTWGEHMDANNKVDPRWMARVKEVVDYCIDDGLYVILNTHHETHAEGYNWLYPSVEKEPTVTPKIKALWTQIANTFKNYDDHLIFETLNEPRLAGTKDEWNGGTPEARQVVNRYNAAALDAIRRTGGNNATRAVMIPTYAASTTSEALRDFQVPRGSSNVIASIHAYSPYNFTMNTTPGESVKTWGSAQDKASLDGEFDWYLNTFKQKGVPVVIGEFGCINKDNMSSRVALAEYYVTAAQKRGIPCIVWDNNYDQANEPETFGLFNRSNLSWYSNELKDAYIRGYKNVHPDSGNTNPGGGNNPGSTNPGGNPGGNPGTSTSKVSVSSKVNNWGDGYQVDFTIKNDTDKDINNWTLRVKKNNNVFTNYWDVKITEENGYYVLRPQQWKSTISKHSSITVSVQGKGHADNNFECKFN